MSQQSHTDSQIHYRRLTEKGRERFEMLVDGRSVSQVEIERLTIRVGCATMRVDGIVGVGRPTLI